MWFIISMVYMSTIAGVSPEIFVYKTTFEDKATCQAVYQNNGQPFIDQMTKLKPNMKNMSIVCVDLQTLQDLKKANKMKKL